MSEAGLWLDGNALAGLLHELFGAELSDSPRGCQSCGAVHPVGAHRLYRGAGLALRCPSCDAIALRIAILPDRYILHMAGTWQLKIPNFERREGH
jgi:hypothetical protein